MAPYPWSGSVKFWCLAEGQFGNGDQRRFMGLKAQEKTLPSPLITNRKSYTGSRLPLNSLTLMILNAKIGVFMDFFGDFELRDTFQERIAPRPIEIDMKKLHIKFLALNADFDGLRLDILSSRKIAYEGMKERYPVKVVISPLLDSLS